METPFQLTFGVEFEFIIRFKPETYRPRMSGRAIAQYFEECDSEQHKLAIMVRCHVIGVLGKCGFLVNPYNPRGKLLKGYDKWGVVPDGSITMDDEKQDPRWAGSCFTGVEVRTPAFPLCSKAFREIEQVLNALNRHFDVHVNPSCGLHVHVGNGDKGFPVDTVKNLCHLVTGFERQINSIHPLHRIENLYAKPPGRVLPSAPLIKNLKALDALDNIPAIVTYFNMFEAIHDSAVAYNLCNLQYTDKHTIEFRQHAGTLDPIAVFKWVELVTGIVSQSHEKPYPAFKHLLLAHIDNSRFSVVDLLHAMNLHSVADYYQLRGTFSHPPQEWEWVAPRRHKSARRG